MSTNATPNGSAYASWRREAAARTARPCRRASAANVTRARSPAAIVIPTNAPRTSAATSAPATRAMLRPPSVASRARAAAPMRPEAFQATSSGAPAMQRAVKAASQPARSASSGFEKWEARRGAPARRSAAATAPSATWAHRVWATKRSRSAGSRGTK